MKIAAAKDSGRKKEVLKRSKNLQQGFRTTGKAGPGKSGKLKCVLLGAQPTSSQAMVPSYRTGVLSSMFLQAIHFLP